jgi:drug/metabolite transporter (DMT)-like permease
MENPAWGALIAAGPPLLYSGILSSGVGFTLQTIGLQKVPPTQASLITSQESTLSVVFGWLLLRETMTGRELIGCAMMLTGVLISQLAPEKKSKSQSLT